MTFKQIQDEVLAAGFSDTAYRARVKDWINDAQARIARDLKLRVWQDQLVVVGGAGVATFNLPGDFAALRFVAITVNGQKYELDQITPRELEFLAVQSGQPSQFQIEGTVVTLYPTPDAGYTYTFNYWSLPTTLTADGDLPELPNPPFHDALVAYATSKAFRRQADPQMADYWRNEYDVLVRELGNELQADTESEAAQVPGAW